MPDLEKMTDQERNNLADDLNVAWHLLRHVPGGHGHVTDACLAAAKLIRPERD